MGMLRGNGIERPPVKIHEADFCVVGGGLAGFCAAISAARHGSRVILMQDRPVLGGSASSEIRMWIRGSDGVDVRETGIVEELNLENGYMNPDMNFSLLDGVFYGMAKREKNLTLLLNCSCLEAQMSGSRIQSVTGWQLTTQTYHQVRAGIFADCSGDSILAPLTGARWRMGREASSDFGESIEPEKEDSRTMGLSCMFQARQTGRNVPFRAPSWAYKYTKDDFPFRMNLKDPDAWTLDNFWWMEIGGDRDSLRDTEEIRDELLKIAYGVWDFIKNSGEVNSGGWELDWLGFLPGKRESRRYEGAYMMCQEDIMSGGRFDDMVAYGGWTMDDHDPRGFATKDRPNIHHPIPGPYGIPYRSLYSANIENLMFAGRNISVSHAVFSSTRVMATCGVVGQAVGTAASIAVREGLDPGQLYPAYVDELQQTLLKDGCYLPGVRKRTDAIMEGARLLEEQDGQESDMGVLTDGVERRVKGVDHAWEGRPGQELVITLPQSGYADALRLVFDCDLNRDPWEHLGYAGRRYTMRCNIFKDAEPVSVPATILRAWQVWVDDGSGVWELADEENNNYQQLRMIPLRRKVRRVKFVPLKTWGCETVRLYAMELTD
ncbi:MAG: FAD-dependent oxidoreductase [Lachnospiraceae bacterium]|nr:FAD-dependent oxidoreductase [Lachnospiraceae bacterium]